MVGHLGIDLASQLNEACTEVPLSRLPGEIERVHRDAVAAQAWARIEGLKSKRLARGRLNDFPNINSHA